MKSIDIIINIYYNFYICSREDSMKFSRRTFLAGLAAASAAAVIPKKQAYAGLLSTGTSGTVATLIDLSLCDGCPHLGTPACVTACRQTNAEKFPEPKPEMLKDYWPQKFHDDWSKKRQVTNRLTPYNWTFVQKVSVEHEGKVVQVNVPRRCMHCDNPPCVKLCPFGTMKKETSGATYVDPTMCFGGAKCKSVCPWKVPQRQAGVGVYTYLDPVPVGGGVMFKCDLCRNELAAGKVPACVPSCPQKAIAFGSRDEIAQLAGKRADEIGGFIYGDKENGGTSTLYVSAVPFEAIDKAIVKAAEDPKAAMRMHNPPNELEKLSPLAVTAMIAPVAGIVGAFAATVSKKEDRNEK